MAFENIGLSIQFFEVSEEFRASAHYLDILEDTLPSIEEEERKHIESVFGRDDDEEQQIKEFLEEQLEVGITTRLFTSGAYLAVWAAYEFGVDRICEILREKRGLSIKRRDLRGSFLDALKKYFGRALNFTLHPEDTNWNDIQMYYRLRNCLAHENGRLNPSVRGDHEALQEWIGARPGVQITDGYVVLSISFVRETLTLLEKLVNELAHRARKEIGLT